MADAAAPLVAAPDLPDAVDSVPDPDSVTFSGGALASEALIVLKPEETGNYKLINLLALTRLVNSAGENGFTVPPGGVFSFLESGLINGDYVIGRDNAGRLVRGGGICAGSSLLATLVVGARQAQAPLVLTHYVRHHTYEAVYHQVNLVGGRPVAVVDAAVLDEPGVYQDLRWVNQDAARYAFHFFLLEDALDGTRVPIDEAAAWAAYQRDPFGPIAAPVYFYGRLLRLP